jgi:hypothetical protein
MIAGLGLATFFLLLVHSILTVYHYQVAEIDWIPWRQLFDVDTENNLPTWFSGALLAVAAFWTWLQADAARALSDRWALHWRVLAFGFLTMSLDEVAGIHETINTVSDITWAIPGGILAMVIAMLYFPFIWNLPSKTFRGFVLAGTLYVGGAVGVEMIGAPMVEDAMPYNLVTVAEEGLEMGGVLVFISTLLTFMNRRRQDSDHIPVAISLND